MCGALVWALPIYVAVVSIFIDERTVELRRFDENRAELCRDRTSAKATGIVGRATSKHGGSFSKGRALASATSAEIEVCRARYARPGKTSCARSFFNNADRLGAGPKTVMPPYA